MNARTRKHFPLCGPVGSAGHYVRVADDQYAGPFDWRTACRLNILVNPDRSPSSLGINEYSADDARYVAHNPDEAGSRFVTLSSVRIDLAAWNRTELDAMLLASLDSMAAQIVN